jgi:glycosyltransferase involved in cell wall biosynthesis
MEQAAVACADRSVFDCAAVREEVVPAGTPARVRSCVIEYGAELELAPDPNVLVDLGLVPRAFDLCLARIEPENHVLEIVRVATRGARPLVVVGDVERARDYGRACRAAAGPAVRFLGALHDAPILTRLRAEARAVLHGHSVGGTNPALLEAMAAGALVLAHDNPYNREVLAAHGLYWRGEEGLARELAALDRLVPGRRAELVNGARARVVAHYTWERIVAAYAAMLEGRTPSVPGAGLGAQPEPAPALPAASSTQVPEGRP